MKKLIDQVPMSVWIGVIGLLFTACGFIYGASISQGERNKQLQVNTTDIDQLKKEKLDKDAFLQFKEEFNSMRSDVKDIRDKLYNMKK